MSTAPKQSAPESAEVICAELRIFPVAREACIEAADRIEALAGPVTDAEVEAARDAFEYANLFTKDGVYDPNNRIRAALEAARRVRTTNPRL